MDPSRDFVSLIERLPKVELHLHLEGSIPRALAHSLAERCGVELPEWFRGDGPPQFTSFREFIDIYLAISRCLVRVEDFAEVAEAVAANLAAHNVVAAEVTFTPMTHVQRGVRADTLLTGLRLGRDRALEHHGVELSWVFDIVRSFPDQAEPTVLLAMHARDQGLVGLGLAGPETEPHHPDIDAAFARARTAGIHAVPHAGEFSGPDSIWHAINVLGAARIGHGIRCLEDPALVDHLRMSQLPLEVCPRSNVLLGVVSRLERHPLPDLMAAGLEVNISTDDPSIFGATLVDEYVSCAQTFAWNEEQIRHVAAAAITHSFLPEARKRDLLAAQAATR